MKVLEIDNVELSFKNKAILNAVYFKAEKGKITGILGSNGSGKSSLLRILFGELKPTNKLIRIDSKPILKPLYAVSNISSLPQFSFVPSSFSLRKIFRIYNLDLESFCTLFSSFEKLVNFRFSKFSGGERRLIETYITIKSNVDIVLLDEPFSHLSPIYNEVLKKVILAEKENKIIVLTDHLYKNILELSDDVYLLKDGWSKKISSPEELIHYNYIYSL